MKQKQQAVQEQQKVGKQKQHQQESNGLDDLNVPQQRFMVDKVPPGSTPVTYWLDDDDLMPVPYQGVVRKLLGRDVSRHDAAECGRGGS